MVYKDAKKKQVEAENLVAENTQSETKEATEGKAVENLFLEANHGYTLTMFLKTILPKLKGR